MKNKPIEPKIETRSTFSPGVWVLVFSILVMILAFVLLILSEYIDDEDWTFVLIAVFAFGGILPAGFACYVSEFLIKRFLVPQNKQLSSFLAITLSFTIALVVVLTFHFIFWILDYFSVYHLSFFEFLFPNHLNNLPEFIFKTNLFFIPSIISIFISTYIGWKTSIQINSDSQIPTKE